MDCYWISKVKHIMFFALFYHVQGKDDCIPYYILGLKLIIEITKDTKISNPDLLHACCLHYYFYGLFCTKSSDCSYD